MHRKIIFSILCFMAVVSCFSNPLRADDDFSIKRSRTIEGSITDVNLSDHRVTVRWMMDPVNFIYRDITVDVLPATMVLKNSEKIDFDDLENGDHVTLKYDPDADPLPQAMSILVVE